MKRTTHRAVVTADNGNTIVGEATAYAWNSAVRASEGIVREWARTHGTCEGGRPVVADADELGPRTYRRVWTAATGRELVALVWAEQ